MMLQSNIYSLFTIHHIHAIPQKSKILSFGLFLLYSFIHFNLNTIAQRYIEIIRIQYVIFLTNKHRMSQNKKKMKRVKDQL